MQIRSDDSVSADVQFAECAQCHTATSSTITDGMHTFCCHGCLTAYAIGNPARADRGADDEYKEYDVLMNAEIASRFVRYLGPTSAVCTFGIPTISCAACVWSLERLDKHLNGITHATVDLSAKRVAIHYNPALVTLGQIAVQLHRMGYEPDLRITTPPRDRSESRQTLIRLAVAGFAAGNIMLMSIASYLAGNAGLPSSIRTAFHVLSIAMALPVCIYSAAPWWRSAYRSIRSRTVSLELPVAIGIAAIFIRSIVEIASGSGLGYLDSGTTLVFFLLIGKMVRDKAFSSIAFDRNIQSFFPLAVQVETPGGTTMTAIRNVQKNDVLVLRNGEALPCDSVLESRKALLDYSFITGESVLRTFMKGERIKAGAKVHGASVRCRATHTTEQSELVSLWERTAVRRTASRLLEVSSTFGAFFTLGVAIVGVVAVAAWLPNYPTALSVLTAILIIACPCAMTLAAPLALGTAMNLLGKRGIMVKNTGVLLDLARIHHVAFDKTGTLTLPAQQIHPVATAFTPYHRLLVRTLALQSIHPVARAVSDALAEHADRIPTTEYISDHIVERPGYGICGIVDGHAVLIGSRAWALQNWPSLPLSPDVHCTYLCVDGVVVATVAKTSGMRTGIPEMLSRMGGKHTISLLSGDTGYDRTLFAAYFANPDIQYEAAPADKVGQIEHLRAMNKRVCMIGDGLNDAPAMKIADVGIAVSGDTAVVVPACDIILPEEDVRHLDLLFAYAQRIRTVIFLAFTVSMVYNAIGLTLAVSDRLSPLAAAILMPVSTLTIIAIGVGGAHMTFRRTPWKS